MKSTLLIATLLCSYVLINSNCYARSQYPQAEILAHAEYHHQYHRQYQHESRNQYQHEQRLSWRRQVEMELARDRELLNTYQIAENHAMARRDWHEVRRMEKMRFHLQRKIASDVRKLRANEAQFNWHAQPQSRFR